MVVLGQSTVEAMVQSTVGVLDQGLVVHILVLQDLDQGHRKNGQEVDQGLALILLKRHLDPQQEAGPDLLLLDRQLGQQDQGQGADQVLQRGQRDQSLEADLDQVPDPPSRPEVDLNLVPQDQIHNHL